MVSSKPLLAIVVKVRGFFVIEIDGLIPLSCQLQL